MTISQKLFEIGVYLKKLNSILFLFFIAITVPNLNIFGAATAFQYSADHKKTVKNHNFISMCLYVIIHKKKPVSKYIFCHNFFIPYPILKNDAFLKS